nr:hypothetical protein [Tanacetum cinerariifolium]
PIANFRWAIRCHSRRVLQSEVDPLNPPPPASESKPSDEIEVENLIEYEDETVHASIHKVGEPSAAPFLREDSDMLFPGLMRKDINSLFGRMDSISRRLCGRETAHALVKKKGKAKDKFYGKLILELGNEVRSSMEKGMNAMEKLIAKLGKAKDKNYGKLILDLGNEVHFSVEQGTTAMERLVEKLSNAKDKVKCEKLKKELEEARFSNAFVRMQKERVERDLYWTRIRAHEFYQEMIHRGFVYEERPNKAINVSIKDEKSLSSEP